MELNLFGGIYQGRRVVVTGHTGFKGSWLALWLTELGARVTGLALEPPTSPSHWQLLRPAIVDSRVDIRDARTLSVAIREANPEIVFHLAAQSLVRRSYADPVDTWATNVMGSVNLLEACRPISALRAIVVVTTDKCYENRGLSRPFREDDPLGGHDPYSASKAAVELLTSSYRRALFGDQGAALIATARAGNVIGGGDWAEDRLVPDAVRALAAGVSLAVRHPDATRPWQHVLECLSGYLSLAASLWNGRRDDAQAWNFGPDDERVTVGELLARFQSQWPALQWHRDAAPRPHENALLSLDSGKARTRLQWRPVWPVDVALRQTVEWYRRFASSQAVTSHDQLAAYIADAKSLSLAWSRS